MTIITVAAAQHAIQPAANWQDFAALFTEHVQTAVQSGAKLLVFAEYGSMGLVAALPEHERRTLAAQLAGMQQFAENFTALFCKLAQQFQVWIVAPTFPFAIANSCYVNRAWITGPDGQRFHQDKLHMTRFENELFAISPGNALAVIDAGNFCFAVAICYDSEFPHQVHALVNAGAQIIAIPSCTDAEHGFHRVLYSAKARALENQCFVVQAPLTGEAPWCEAIDINIGTAGVFSPIDRDFPADGTLAHSADIHGWAIAHCNLTRMQQVRDDGQVFNLRDWRQPIPPVSTQKTN
jgi:predicted amidohydrolase